MPSSHVMETYKRLPVAFASGSGATLVDTDGREYLDAVSGIAVCNLGHAHPAVTEALCSQAGRLVHTSNLYGVPLQEEVGAELGRLSGLDRVFFANSGAEANEAAIKLARRLGHAREIERPEIVVMQGSFHGRTMATLTATGNRRVQAGFEPLVPGFKRIPYNDLEAVERVASESTVAVLVEPIQGEGGVTVPDAEYLAGLRRLCDDRGWLLMLDEVQTGMGRTGAWFAYQHAGIRPDVVTVAKALGNGFPVGAMLATESAAELLGPGTHATTFGGSPLAMAAVGAVLRAMEEEGLVARAAETGDYLKARLEETVGRRPEVREIRGKGLMLGIEVDADLSGLMPKALEHGLLVNVTAERVIRLLPPLILTREQADRIAEGLDYLLGELL
ncbi:acetylornithine aminotransferase [Thiohalorhabdus denitrificans]|uniref:Acetylornithine aminotransferase n=1 Tax=Thiohalorhabdus denitrificans TaxID=381306 RepID=A0A0P9CKT4_9GAMM|nr:aspartate aminotransferase family protein [Thiohalorhabdus denitrificans]KPV39585.1 acetylornithine aminotransferase [Thiohalorhabdus denitrificans]SCX97711.1 acetylornithine aminotransferase [Thiohalorhabdus denitrificans]